jgi:ABC-2 type transport system permease protein
MTGFMPLLKKEITEQIKTYRLLIVGGVFLFFAILDAVTLKFLPEILKMSGETIDITMPPVTPVQSLAEYAGNVGQIGVLVVILVAMGMVANERRHGTALLTLSKPVTPLAFVTAKLCAVSLTLFVSVAVASLVSFGYTTWLFGASSVAAFTGQILLMILFLILCAAVTVLFSSFYRNSLAAGGITILIIIVQGIFSSFPWVGPYLPGKLLGWGTNLISGKPDAYWGALGVTVAGIVLCLYFAQHRLKNEEI